MATLSSTNNGYSSQGVSSLIGLDAFSEILSLLPDDFFDGSQEKRDSYWRQVYHEAAQGNQDVTRLAELYRPSYNKSTVSDETKDTRQ